MTLETIAPLSDDPTVNCQHLQAGLSGPLPANAVTRTASYPTSRDTIASVIDRAWSFLQFLRPLSETRWPDAGTM
jgi:hypothetical protein